jgi:hypothetical protein
MRGVAARRASVFQNAGLLLGFSLLLGMSLLLCACGHHRPDSDGESSINVYPTNYKSDILGAMHAYLNNPTGIRDAAISEPAIKTIGGTARYVVCLELNAKKNGSNDYAGMRVIVAAFFTGRFDQFVETTKDVNTKDICAGVTYVPFPELQKLPP